MPYPPCTSVQRNDGIIVLQRPRTVLIPLLGKVFPGRNAGASLKLLPARRFGSSMLCSPIHSGELRHLFTIKK